MSQFRYRALTRSGEVVIGEMTAHSAAAVIERLQDQGQIPVHVDEVAAGGWANWLKLDLTTLGKPSHHDLAIFMHELAALIRASVPVDRALDILIRLAHTRRLRRLLTQVQARVRGGATLADAFAAGGGFPKLYVSMIRAGETGGMLEQSLTRLAEFVAKFHSLRETVKSALVYPLILLTVAGATLVVIMTAVVPRFEPLFRDAGVALPVPTQILMSASNFLRSYGWALLIVPCLIFLALPYLRKSRPVTYRWHAGLLRAPLFGDLVTKIETARFSRTLGSLLGNGVPLPTAIAITRETLTNLVLADALDAVASRLKEGGGLSDLLEKSGVFPELSVHLSRLGEETGHLEEMLIHQADIFDREAQRTIDRLMALFVPALTIGLGFLVGGIIMSVLVALLRVNDLAI